MSFDLFPWRISFQDPHFYDTHSPFNHDKGGNKLNGFLEANMPGKNGSVAAFNISLAKAGCFWDETKGPDCTTACLNSTLVWGNKSTLHNCMYYPIITHLLVDKKLSKDDQTLAASFGNFTPDIAAAIQSNISACATEYCDQQGICNENKSEWRPSVDGSYHWRVPYFCGAIKTNVNPDIGGIGVMISYIIQSSIAGLAWIWLSLYRPGSVVRVICSCYRCARWPIRWWGRFTSRKNPRIKTVTQESKPPPFFITAPIEFHKTQCFFNTFVLVASIIALKRPEKELKAPKGQNLLGALSYFQLVNNLTFIRGSAIGNILPLICTLISLSFAGVTSACLTFLTWMPVILSLLVRLKYWKSDESALEKIDWAPNCGQYNPSQHCPPYYEIGILSLIANRLFLAIYLICFLLPQLDQLLTFYFERFHASENSWKKWLEKAIRKRSNHGWWLKVSSWLLLDNRYLTPRTVTRIFNYTLDLLTFYSFAAYIYFLIAFISGSSSQRPRSDDINNWSWSQILAVTVWIPPVFEFIYLFIRGMHKGSQYRFPAPYQVINTDQHDSLVMDSEDDIVTSSDDLQQIPLRPDLQRYKMQPSRTI